MPMGMPLQSWGAPGGIMEGVNELGRAMSNMPGNVAQARATQAQTRHQQLADAFLYGAADKNDAAQMEADRAGARARALDEESKRAEIDYKKGSLAVQQGGLDVQRGAARDAVAARRFGTKERLLQHASEHEIDPDLATDLATEGQPTPEARAPWAAQAERTKAANAAKLQASMANVETGLQREFADIFGEETVEEIVKPLGPDGKPLTTEKKVHGLVGDEITTQEVSGKIKRKAMTPAQINKMLTKGPAWLASLPEGHRYKAYGEALLKKYAAPDTEDVTDTLQGAKPPGVDRSQEITQAMGGATAAPEPVISDADKLEMTKLMKILTKFPGHAEAKATLETYKAKYGIK